MEGPTHPDSRRGFLRRVCELLTALLGAALGIPLIGFSIAPLFQKRKEVWVKLGVAEGVKRGEPTKFTYSYLRNDAYLEKIERGTAYAVTEDGVHFKVFSNVCTHAGCGVRWDPKQRVFQCPCHNGKFDVNGEVVGGPPPRPLNQFAYRVAEGQLSIKMRA